MFILCTQPHELSSNQTGDEPRQGRLKAGGIFSSAQNDELSDHENMDYVTDENIADEV